MQRAGLHWESGLKLCTASCANCISAFTLRALNAHKPTRGHSAACRHQPPHVSLVRLTASHVLQHVQLSRPHNACFARISLFLLYRNSARLLRLLCPASLAMDLQRMVAENQNNPAFLQDIIRMLAQSQSDAGSVHPEDASNAPRPSNTDLLDFSEPHVAMLHRPPSRHPQQRNPSARQSQPPAPPGAPRGQPPRACA